ncbi:MAG: phosphatase PAP2 family protein [Dactylosporangium sp.]|nr:phosphatase PAP2 family protein [Dactylosporangium sp.]NNJ60884.1 phosphatase PAP2 family protein [Dactylosporangium sp.]
MLAFALFWRFIGLPTDIIAALGWLWLATICWRIGRPFRDHLAFLRDWLPVAAVLSIYDVSRGFADNGAQPHLHEMIRFDRWLIGGNDLPTHWMQRAFYDPDVVHWWDLVVSAIYFSHFIATPVAAVVLWLRSRQRWVRFTRRWIALSIAGLSTYFLFPAAPPWWADERAQVIDPVARISTRGWDLIGMRTAGHLLNVAQQNLSNEVAAMPSLHSAFALFVVAFFLPTVRRRWWPLLLSYPAAMAVVLVYSGEHWVIDALVGFVYVGLVFIGVAALEAAWARWRTSPLVGPVVDSARQAWARWRTVVLLFLVTAGHRARQALARRRTERTDRAATEPDCDTEAEADECEPVGPPAR